MKEGVAQDLPGNKNKDQQTVFAVVSKPNGKVQQAMPEVGQNVPQIEDPFDPSNYRKPQDPRLNLGSEQCAGNLPNTIEPRKPKKSWFVRVHPDPGYRVVLPLYIDDDSKRREGNSYLFAPGLEIPPDLESLVRDTLVAAAITNAGVPFLYTLSITDSTWYESGIEAIRLATERWVRVTSGDGCYLVTYPVSVLSEPRFPDVPFRDYLERAFAKRLIKTHDHPLVKKLRGA
jgi:hypothetical protein